MMVGMVDKMDMAMMVHGHSGTNGIATMLGMIRPCVPDAPRAKVYMHRGTHLCSSL